MTTVAMTVEVPGVGSFDTFEEAAQAGYPFACEQFLLCENAASVAVEHPVLGAVPTCARCAARVEALS